MASDEWGEGLNEASLRDLLRKGWMDMDYYCTQNKRVLDVGRPVQQLDGAEIVAALERVRGIHCHRHLPLLARHRPGGCDDGVAGVHPYYPGSVSPCYPFLQDPCYPSVVSLLAHLAQPLEVDVSWIALPCDCSSLPFSVRVGFSDVDLGYCFASYRLPVELVRACREGRDLILPRPTRLCCIQSHRRDDFRGTDLYCNRREDIHSFQF